ncbi:hypothetical protein Hypma_014246 [Hypsizygus marmoreus]|uniref:Uncharacterized protein n=1 Tax=Hypsizygus marmoreus TaxID=39966 RepID=A0A369JCS9_HYPMA|nr:hypothetical protein Hypma_014246 [Hypsizygus marmoreus]
MTGKLALRWVNNQCRYFVVTTAIVPCGRPEEIQDFCMTYLLDTLRYMLGRPSPHCGIWMTSFFLHMSSESDGRVQVLEGIVRRSSNHG